MAYLERVHHVLVLQRVVPQAQTGLGKLSRYFFKRFRSFRRQILLNPLSEPQEQQHKVDDQKVHGVVHSLAAKDSRYGPQGSH